MLWGIYHLGPLERRSGHKSFGLFCFAAVTMNWHTGQHARSLRIFGYREVSISRKWVTNDRYWDAFLIWHDTNPHSTDTGEPDLKLIAIQPKYLYLLTSFQKKAQEINQYALHRSLRKIIIVDTTTKFLSYWHFPSKPVYSVYSCLLSFPFPYSGKM